MSVQGKSPISHLPVSPATNPGTFNVPVVAGNAVRSLTAPGAGNRSLIIGAATIQVDVTKHTQQNVMDLINGANLPSVTATLDRYGQLLINGVNSVGGDALLLQHLGLA